MYTVAEGRITKNFISCTETKFKKDENGKENMKKVNVRRRKERGSPAERDAHC
jgi:hypothetical protein